MISVTKQDIDRMRLLSLSTQNSDSAKRQELLQTTTKNEQLHRMSKQRVEKWSNTLEAIRKKKEDYLVEKEREREQRFAELDVQVKYG